MDASRSRQELSYEYFLAKFGVDTAENEPLEVWGKIQFIIHLPPYSLHPWLGGHSIGVTRSPSFERPRHLTLRKKSNIESGEGMRKFASLHITLAFCGYHSVLMICNHETVPHINGTCTPFVVQEDSFFSLNGSCNLVAAIMKDSTRSQKRQKK